MLATTWSSINRAAFTLPILAIEHPTLGLRAKKPFIIVRRLARPLELPTALSHPTERYFRRRDKLYVIPSMESTVYVFDVTGPGKIENRRVLCELKQRDGEKDKGGDGLTIDVAGNLYITTGLGLQVVSPEGKHLGIIAVPEHPANAAFGGADMSTIYITARTGFYSVPMSIKGHRFTGTVKP